MILVCDKTVSKRATSTREAILASGLPCAVSAVDGIMQLLPVRIIVSFTDISEVVAKIPIHGVRKILIGTDFVNSALEVKCASGIPAAIELISSSLYELYGITDEKKSAFGVSPTPAVFFSKDFFTINGCAVEPTESEYMIFKYLAAFSASDDRFPSDRISKFCMRRDLPKNVPVHIANLNKKIGAVYREHIIKSSRGLGYYAVKL